MLFPLSLKSILVALLLVPLLPSLALAQHAPPNAAAGKALWENEDTFCFNCHGRMAEGGFGPTLAGQGLTPAQVQKAVRTPAGIMPAFVPSQFSDAGLANLAAYFASLPKPAAPGPWRVMPDAHMPAGQQTLVNVGCAQCHGAVLEGPRGLMGGVGGDFATFKKLVYTHTAATLPIYELLGSGNPALPPDKGGPIRGTRKTAPPLRMGNFNPQRVTETQLKQIYDWARNDIGFCPLLQGRISAGAVGPRGANYTLKVTNDGVKGRGLTGEGITIGLILPSGSTVTAATGQGYKGVRRDPQAKADIAEWQIARMAAKDAAIFTVTLSKPATAANNLRGTIRWASPAPKSGVYRDAFSISPPVL